MTRLVSWLVALLVGMTVVIGLVVTQAAPAHACSIAPSFVVTAEHFEAGDVNDPDGQLATEYREWTGDDTASLEVLGVYVYETIAEVESEGDYSRGSVSVPVEMWGEWPADTSARAVAPRDQTEESDDPCGWGPSGRPLGTRSYSIIWESSTSDFVDIKIDDDAQAALTSVFGSPVIADRDLDVEQELIAQIQRSSRRSTPIFVGVGVVALATAAAVMYRSRRSSSATNTSA